MKYNITLEKLFIVLGIINWGILAFSGVHIIETFFYNFPPVIQLIYLNFFMSGTVLLVDSHIKKYHVKV